MNKIILQNKFGSVSIQIMKLFKVIWFIPLTLSEISRVAGAMEMTAVEVVNMFGGIKNYAKLRRVITAQKLGNN